MENCCLPLRGGFGSGLFNLCEPHPAMGCLAEKLLFAGSAGRQHRGCSTHAGFTPRGVVYHINCCLAAVPPANAGDVQPM